MSGLHNLVALSKSGGYSSELGSVTGSDVTRVTSADRPSRPSVASRVQATGGPDRERRRHYDAITKMDPYTRHKKFINDVIHYYGGLGVALKAAQPQNQPVTDHDVMKEEYRFLRKPEDDISAPESSWRKKMARKYYDKLFKEYCIADLSRYKEGKIGMRWRVEREVVIGKGQFTCGNKKCEERDKLHSYEVPFRYSEGGEQKSALVKLRLCPKCGKKLTFKYPHAREIAKEQDRKRRKTKPGREHRGPDSVEGAEISEGSRGLKQEETTPRLESRTIEKATPSESEVWKQKPQAEKTLEDEFDEYFDEMCGDLLM